MTESFVLIAVIAKKRQKKGKSTVLLSGLTNIFLVIKAKIYIVYMLQFVNNKHGKHRQKTWKAKASLVFVICADGYVCLL